MVRAIRSCSKGRLYSTPTCVAFGLKDLAASVQKHEAGAAVSLVMTSFGLS